MDSRVWGRGVVGVQSRVCKLENLPPKWADFGIKGFGFVRLNGRLEVAAWFLLQFSKDIFTCRIEVLVFVRNHEDFSNATRVRLECYLEVN